METWFRLPREVRVVIGAAVAFSFAVLAFLAWDFDRLHNGFNGSRMVGWLALAGLIGPLVSLFLFGGDDGLRRRFGSIEEFFAYNRALRTAELPARIDPDVWRDWLHVSRRTNRMAQLLAYLVVLFVVLPSLIRQPWYHPVAVSLLGLLATVSLVLSWWKRARITLLAAEVERLAAARAAQSGGDPTRPQMTPENAALSWLRLPLAVRFGIGAAVGFSLAFGVVVLDRLLNGYHDALVEYVAWAASLALVAGVVLAYEGRVRRNFGSFEQFIAYNRAFRAGELPERIEPDGWRGWLSRSRRLNRMEPLRAAVLVVLGVLPSLINHSAYWVTASMFGLLAILSLVGSWQTRARIIRLTAEVEQRATRGSTV